MKKILFFFVLLFAAWLSHAQTYNTREFGATTDTSKLNTKAIQSAIDKCNKDGGGEVEHVG